MDNGSDQPELYEKTFPYSSLPRIEFEEKTVPMNMPEEIWITDTTFRDGQQAREPYTTEQMVHIFKLLSKLSGREGTIRFTEFFLYTKRDRKTVECCLDLGYEYARAREMGTVTYHLHRLMDGAELVSTSGFGDMVIGNMR